MFQKCENSYVFLIFNYYVKYVLTETIALLKVIQIELSKVRSTQFTLIFI